MADPEGVPWVPWNLCLEGLPSKLLQHDFHEKVALSDPVNVLTDRDSTCDVMDGSKK